MVLWFTWQCPTILSSHLPRKLIFIINLIRVKNRIIGREMIKWDIPCKITFYHVKTFFSIWKNKNNTPIIHITLASTFMFAGPKMLTHRKGQARQNPPSVTPSLLISVSMITGNLSAHTLASTFSWPSVQFMNLLYQSSPLPNFSSHSVLWNVHPSSTTYSQTHSWVSASHLLLKGHIHFPLWYTVSFSPFNEKLFFFPGHIPSISEQN